VAENQNQERQTRRRRASTQEVASGQDNEATTQGAQETTPPQAAPQTLDPALIEEQGHGAAAYAASTASLRHRLESARLGGDEAYIEGLEETVGVVEEAGIKDSEDPIEAAGTVRSELITRVASLEASGERVRANGVGEGISALARIQDGYAEDRRLAEIEAAERQERGEEE
jgi:hypothetical protein